VRKLTLSLAVMAALLPLRGYSLGLGDLELHSALNQELNAEIKVLSAESEDSEQILIKLADRDAFNRAGLDRPHLLQQLKFKIIDKNGVPYVKVYTKAPIREPFLSFLLEIDWPQGHLLREFTMLLDPPVYNNSTTGAGAASSTSSFNEPTDTQAQTQSANSQQQNAQSVQTGVISSDDGRSESYQYQSLPDAAVSTDQYRVQQNDTLWGIANRMRPDSSISVEQMMLALVRKNPEAFIRENTNGVKRGYILRAPDRDEITRLDRQQAVAQAREHTALWREYRQSATSASPQSAMEADAMGTESGSAAEQTRDADGHLSIMGAGEGGEHTGSNQSMDAELNQLKQNLAMANEQLESERLEKEDLRARLAELEQRVKSVIESGGRVEMGDSELAKLQEDLQSTQQAAQETAQETMLDVPAEDSMSDSMADDDTAKDEMSDAALTDEGMSDEVMSEDMASDDMSADKPAEDAMATDAPADDAIFADEDTAKMSDDEMADAQMPTQDTDTVKAVTPPAFAQQQPKGFLEGLMDDPKLLGMIGGGVAFILLLIALLMKRIRSKKAEEDEWTAGMADPSEGADNDFSSISGAELGSGESTVQSEAPSMDQTTEMPVDSETDFGLDKTRVKVPESDDGNEDTVFNIKDAQPEAGAEEDGRDDVLAEADVYLAYGIYQQAEELLNSAIDQNPERDDYRLKLLETHHAAKNTSAFENLATEVQSRKSNDKEYWDRVVAMGSELSPTNAMFAGGDTISDFDAEALLTGNMHTSELELDAGSETDDFDLGLDSDLDSDLGDSGFDDAELEDTLVGTKPVETEELDLAGDLDDIASELDETVAEPETELSGLEEENTSTELEFDLGDLGDMDEVESTEEVSESSADTAEMDIDDDFSLDFDAADLGFEETEDDAEDELALDADLDLSDGLGDEAVEIDLSADMGDSLSDAAEVDQGDIDLGDVDLGDMDLGDMDLGDSSADLSADDDEFDISELSEDVDEVSTKLDLARAYIDMGDNEGARSILEEVKAEGNNDQQQQADELLQQAS